MSTGMMEESRGYHKAPKKEIEGYRFRTNAYVESIKKYSDPKFLIVNEAFDVYGRLMGGYVAIYEKVKPQVEIKKIEDIKAAIKVLNKILEELEN